MRGNGNPTETAPEVGAGIGTQGVASVLEKIKGLLTPVHDLAAQQLEAERRRLNRMGKVGLTPTDIRLKGSAVVVSTIAVVPLWSPAPSPDQGFVWILRNICIGRGDAALGTGAGGVAAVIVSPSPPGGQAPSATNITWEGVKDQFTLSALGPPQHYSSRQIVVKSEEFLYVVVTGGTNGQQIFAQADVEQVQERAAPAVFDI